jgi:2-keto-4-pentenoate hydratase
MSAAHVGIELVCSRFVDANVAGLPSFLGDDIGFRGYILGDEIPRADWPAAFAAHAEIKHGGVVVSPNLGDESRTDAVHALALFIDDAEKDGVPIEPGMLITTGSLVGPYRTAEPGLYAGSLGRYAVSCTIDKK